MQRIYLAAPYSHPDPVVRQWRTELADKAAAYLMQANDQPVFSPLSHSHRVADHIDNHLDHDFWLRQDLGWLEACDWMYVLMLPGWDQSDGVALELEWAKKWQITIRYLEPVEVGIDLVGAMMDLVERQEREKEQKQMIDRLTERMYSTGQ